MNYEIKIKDNKTFINKKACVFCNKPLSYCPEIDEIVDVRILQTQEIITCVIKGWKCDVRNETVTLFAKSI